MATPLSDAVLLAYAIAAALLVMSAHSSSPPVIASQSLDANPIFAKEGRDVKLPCPVNHAVFMEWLHNGKTVSEATRDVTPKVDGRNSFLRISNPRASDSGLYTCKVANGFGSVSLNLTLIVLGGLNGHPDGAALLQPGDEQPHFTHSSTDMASQAVVLDSQATLRLRCRARGWPPLAVKWYVNGAELIEERIIARTSIFDSTGQQLKLDNMKVGDSGSYTCLVYNRAGSANFTFSVTVQEPSTMTTNSPHIQQPPNGTFNLGEPASLQCYVESSVFPRIQWLKEVSEHSSDVLEPSKGLELIGSRSFLHVKRIYTQTAHMQPNVYMSKLHISAVRPEHAGAYVCSAFIGNDVISKEAYMIVHAGSEDPLPSSEAAGSPAWPYVFGSQSATLAIIVAVPSLIAILVAIVIIYTVNKRKQERRAHDAKQKRLLLRQDNAYQQGSCGGHTVVPPTTPDYAFEEKASVVTTVAFHPGTVSTALGGAVPLLPPVTGSRLLSSAYSCSDGSYHSFVHRPYYGHEMHGDYLSDSESQFSSISRYRDNGRRLQRFAQQMSDYEDYASVQQQCPPPPPPSCY